MVALFPAKLFGVDDSTRNSAYGFPQLDLSRHESAADDRKVTVDVKHSALGSALSHLSHVINQRGPSLPRNRFGGSRVESETGLAKNTSLRIGTATVVGLMALLLVTAKPAHAVVFNIGGPGGAAGVDMSTTSGLYASGRDEVATL